MEPPARLDTRKVVAVACASVCGGAPAADSVGKHKSNTRPHSLRCRPSTRAASPGSSACKCLVLNQHGMYWSATASHLAPRHPHHAQHAQRMLELRHITSGSCVPAPAHLCKCKSTLTSVTACTKAAHPSLLAHTCCLLHAACFCGGSFLCGQHDELKHGQAQCSSRCQPPRVAVSKE